MKRVFDHIRDHLLSVSGYDAKIDPNRGKHPGRDSLRQSEGNPAFYHAMAVYREISVWRDDYFTDALPSHFQQLMANRLVMGSFRYDLWNDKKASKWDLFGSLWTRLKVYEQTGNLEMLVDCANFLQIEYTFPSSKELQFKGLDSSPVFVNIACCNCAIWVHNYINREDVPREVLAGAAIFLEEEFNNPKHPSACWVTEDDGIHVERA